MSPRRATGFATAGNLLTVSNLTCGVSALAATVWDDLWLACWLLVLGAALDFTDGKLAKVLGQASDLGLQLDSLADAVTFGIVPPAVVLAYQVGQDPSSPAWVLVAALAFVLSSVWRLAKFNLQQDKSYFVGMPTTLNGVFLPALYVFGAAGWMWAYLLVAAVLMNLPARLPNWGR